MTASSIPTPGTITAGWLTERLREAGHAGVEVLRFEGTRIGTGQIGQCIRYELDTTGGDGSAPRRLVGKFPSDNPASQQTGVRLLNYLKEVSFYREVQPRVNIRTPRCYFAAIEGEGPEHMLLLEDLAPAVQGDQLRGCSPEVARTAVLELAGLHAPSWCDTTLRGQEWLEPASLDMENVRALYRDHLSAFLDRFSARLAADEISIIERVASSAGPPFETDSDVFSLVHVDYRLDNLLIDDALRPPAVTVVDWQSLTLANPLQDVAYFLGGSLPSESRLKAEREIVASYHRQLCEAGVGDFGWERCWDDYRRNVFSGFVVTVIASVMVQQTARGDEMFTVMARRHARQALDLGSDEFLTP